ncbi:MAG: PQQ-binding-like beta-propeller repeat protein [Spirochaetales bacterium]|nr:PQQ-binding-like beta-propeller repeat protein [Spirochaetales bacterium]
MRRDNPNDKTRILSHLGSRAGSVARRASVRSFMFVFCFFLLAVTGCRKESGGADNPAARRPSSDWPIFRGDAGLTGLTRDPLPEKLVLDFTLAAGDDIAASPVVAGGNLFAATTGGSIIAFDLERRARLWEYANPDGFEAAPLALPGEALVVAGGLDGWVYALDAGSGTLKWKAETEGKIAGSANYLRAGGRALVLVGSWDRSLYAFDAATGAAAWKFATANYVNGAAAVGGGLAAVGGCDARLHFIDCAGGREEGSVDTGAYIAGSAALAGGVAYVGNYGGRFLAVDASSRRIRWSFDLPAEGRGFEASPAVAGKHVVIGAKDGFVYCLDRAHGALAWKFRGRDQYLASCLTDGTRVLAASADGELALLDLASGRLLSSYDLGADVTGSPAYASGHLVVAALDGGVYVFRGE